MRSKFIINIKRSINNTSKNCDLRQIRRIKMLRISHLWHYRNTGTGTDDHCMRWILIWQTYRVITPVTPGINDNKFILTIQTIKPCYYCQLLPLYYGLVTLLTSIYYDNYPPKPNNVFLDCRLDMVIKHYFFEIFWENNISTYMYHHDIVMSINLV